MIGTNTYLHGPMDYAKTLKLHFRVGDLALPERTVIPESRKVEKDADAQICHCGKAKEGGSHIVGESEMYKEDGMCWR